MSIVEVGNRDQGPGTRDPRSPGTEEKRFQEAWGEGRGDRGPRSPGTGDKDPGSPGTGD